MEKLAFERAANLYDLALRATARDLDRAAVLTAMADALAGALATSIGRRPPSSAAPAPTERSATPASSRCGRWPIAGACPS